MDQNSENSKYWTSFYSDQLVTSKPSPFAISCLPYIKEGSTLIDVGCGNGRDSSFFAKCGINVLSIDQSFPQELFATNCFFLNSDVDNMPNIKCDYIYARFFIHAISLDKEIKFLNYIKKNCKHFFIEARSDKSKFKGDHYRRFINLEELKSRLDAQSFDYTIEESKNLAKTDTENPVIIRVSGSNDD
jgi:tellurite methyltransferase